MNLPYLFLEWIPGCKLRGEVLSFGACLSSQCTPFHLSGAMVNKETISLQGRMDHRIASSFGPSCIT